MTDSTVAAIVVPLVTVLAWVVKRVFEVVEHNTRVNEQVSNSIGRLAEKVDGTARDTSNIANGHREIVETQKDILSHQRQILKRQEEIKTILVARPPQIANH